MMPVNVNNWNIAVFLIKYLVLYLCILLFIWVLWLKFKQTTFYKYADLSLAFSSAVRLVKRQIILDFETPSILLKQRPHFLILAYKLTPLAFIIVVLQFVGTLVYLLFLYIHLIFCFLFKTEHVWFEKNESILFKYLIRATLYEVFIAIPRARAFAIFYISLKSWYVSINFLIVNFKLGRPIIEPIVIIHPLTFRQFEEMSMRMTNRLSTCLLTLLFLGVFVLIKLPISLILGVSYVSFILSCRFMYNSHWECWSWKRNSLRNLYERTLVFGIITTVNSTYIEKYKISGKLQQVDIDGHVVHNQFFPKEANDQFIHNSELRNDVVSDTAISKPQQFNSLTKDESEENEDELIEKAFAAVFGERTLAEKNMKDAKGSLSLDEAQAMVDDINKELDGIDAEIDYSVFSKGTKLQYRLIFNPKYLHESKVKQAFLESGILTKTNNLPISLDRVGSYNLKGVLHPCFRILNCTNSSSNSSQLKIIFKGLSSTFNLVFNSNSSLNFRANDLQHEHLINSQSLAKRQFSIPTAIGDKTLFLEDEKWVSDSLITNTFKKKYLESIAITLYNRVVVEVAIGNTFEEYHLTYNKNAKNGYLSINAGKLGIQHDALLDSEITFVLDVKLIRQFINELYITGLLDTAGIEELKLQLLLATTNVNDLIIIPGKKNRFISYNDLLALQEANRHSQRSYLINKIYDNAFGNYLSKFENKLI